MAGPREETRRQRIADLLAGGEYGFEELRRELEMPVHLLEADLQHLARSLRRSGRRLRLEPARCRACGFVFRQRAERRFYTPGRCPRCRSERIAPARLRIET